MEGSRLSFMTARTGSNLQTLHSARREYPTSAEAYELLEECGRGVSATVWRALCKPYNEVVAVKLLDLENMNCSLDEIVREAQTMRQLNHPNLLPLYCSFVHKQHLWMVMPYVQGGSVLNIMRFAYPEGLEEPVIATIMKDVLKALEYLHRHGIIHRDIKAGNILLDNSGQVLLADFGVAATLERGGSWGNKMMARNTFVGTPCWMAPEVMEQSAGYDSRADIWSFGITLLELAHGHAPFARLPPMKVLLMTIQNPPPTLESDNSKKHFSKAMRELVAKCLVKDPTKRPTAAQLLDNKFFKTAHDSLYLQKHLLAGLPSVPERVQMMRQGQASRTQEQDNKDILASQQEYRKGVSSWNFDVQALKAAAAAQADEDRLPPITEASEVAELMHQPSIAALVAGAAATPPVTDGLAPAGAIPAGSGSPGGPGKPGASPLPAAAPGPASRTTSGDRPPLAKTPSKERVLPGAQPLPAAASGVPGVGAAPAAGVPPGSAAAAAAAAAALHRPSIKEQGRFKVYEGDEPPPFRQSSLDGATGAAAAAEAASVAADLEGAEKAKRKGRFRYVEDDFGDSKARLGSKSGSVANLADQKSLTASSGVPSSGAAGGAGASTGAAAGVAATVLLAPLKKMLEAATLQQEVMREMVAALADLDRGRTGSLNTFLQEKHYLRPPREELERLRHEVGELREDNARLREQLRLAGVSPGGGDSRKSSASQEAPPSAQPSA
ncbi:hypothetical protein N2152v2_007316 [Parachlorella kessleri]